MARPREFDERQVLEAAGNAFWRNGYEATSTRDLVKVTGLTQPSLYNAFGDKRGLFRRALEHYLENSLRERMARAESSMTPGQAITGFLRETIERSVSDPQKRGCMLVNSALEVTPDDEEFREAIAAELAEMKAFFRRCMAAGHRSGEIPETVSADAAANMLLAVTLGMRVMARVTPERAVLSAPIAPTLALLGLPPLPI